MNLWINAINVAGRPLRSVCLALEDENTVAPLGGVGPIKRQPEFDGHIESWYAFRQFNSGQIVDREIRSFDKLDNRFQSSLIWNGKSCVHARSKLGQAHNIGQVQILELLVIGNIEEDGLNALHPRHV